MADSQSGPVVTTTSPAWSWPRKPSVLPKPSVPWKNPVRPRHQPSESTTSQVLSPATSSVADVVDLDVQGGRVAGEARRQLDVADAPAVEEGLVDRRAPWRRAGPRDGGARRAGTCGAARGRSARSPRGSIQRAVQSDGSSRPGLEPGRRRPVALGAVGPDLDPPDDPLPGGQGCAGPGDEDAGVGFDPVQRAAVDLEGVRLLRARTRRQSPGQAGPTVAEAEDGVAEVLDPEVGGRVHVGDVSAPIGARTTATCRARRPRSAYGLFMDSECGSALIATVL